MTEREDEMVGRQPTRIEALADGIFAVAMTGVDPQVSSCTR